MRSGTYAGDPVKYLRDMPVIEAVGTELPVRCGNHRDLGRDLQSGSVIGLLLATCASNRRRAVVGFTPMKRAISGHE